MSDILDCYPIRYTDGTSLLLGVITEQGKVKKIEYPPYPELLIFKSKITEFTDVSTMAFDTGINSRIDFFQIFLRYSLVVTLEKYLRLELSQFIYRMRSIFVSWLTVLENLDYLLNILVDLRLKIPYDQLLNVRDSITDYLDDLVRPDPMAYFFLLGRLKCEPPDSFLENSLRFSAKLIVLLSDSLSSLIDNRIIRDRLKHLFPRPNLESDPLMTRSIRTAVAADSLPITLENGQMWNGYQLLILRCQTILKSIQTVQQILNALSLLPQITNVKYTVRMVKNQFLSHIDSPWGLVGITLRFSSLKKPIECIVENPFFRIVKNTEEHLRGIDLEDLPIAIHLLGLPSNLVNLC